MNITNYRPLIMLGEVNFTTMEALNSSSVGIAEEQLELRLCFKGLKLFPIYHPFYGDNKTVHIELIQEPSDALYNGSDYYSLEHDIELLTRFINIHKPTTPTPADSHVYFIPIN